MAGATGLSVHYSTPEEIPPHPLARIHHEFCKTHEICGLEQLEDLELFVVAEIAPLALRQIAEHDATDTDAFKSHHV